MQRLAAGTDLAAADQISWQGVYCFCNVAYAPFEESLRAQRGSPMPAGSLSFDSQRVFSVKHDSDKVMVTSARKAVLDRGVVRLIATLWRYGDEHHFVLTKAEHRTG